MHWTNIEFKMKFNLHCHSNLDLMSKKKLKTKKVRVEHRGGGHLEFDSFPGEPKEVTRRLLGLWRTGNLARKKFTNQTSKMPNSHYYSFKIIIMHEPTTINIWTTLERDDSSISQASWFCAIASPPYFDEQKSIVIWWQPAARSPYQTSPLSLKFKKKKNSLPKQISTCFLPSCIVMMSMILFISMILF